MQNSGQICVDKASQTCRLFIVNSCGLGPDLGEKLEIIAIKISSKQIDSQLFSSCDRELDSYAMNSMKNKLKCINSKLELTVLDSRYHFSTKNTQMPREMISTLFGKWTNITNQNILYKDNKGRQYRT